MEEGLLMVVVNKLLVFALSFLPCFQVVQRVLDFSTETQCLLVQFMQRWLVRADLCQDACQMDLRLSPISDGDGILKLGNRLEDALPPRGNAALLLQFTIQVTILLLKV